MVTMMLVTRNKEQVQSVQGSRHWGRLGLVTGSAITGVKRGWRELASEYQRKKSFWEKDFVGGEGVNIFARGDGR